MCKIFEVKLPAMADTVMKDSMRGVVLTRGGLHDDINGVWQWRNGSE
jgi:hypothetical protein